MIFIFFFPTSLTNLIRLQKINPQKQSSACECMHGYAWLREEFLRAVYLKSTPYLHPRLLRIFVWAKTCSSFLEDGEVRLFYTLKMSATVMKPKPQKGSITLALQSDHKILYWWSSNVCWLARRWPQGMQSMIWLLLSPLLGRKPAGLEIFLKQLVTQDVSAVCCYYCFLLAKSLSF